LKRVIAARLEAHITQREPGRHNSQYGFRQGRSTVDPVEHARRAAQGMVTHQGVALAVSLDITNAFNSIPWNKIIEALRYHPVPQYLVEVIQACLNDRWVEFNSKTGITRRPVERGVPQGSVLGPILWITAYDRVLRCPRPL
jgi:retron-type reverse transcriptase